MDDPLLSETHVEGSLFDPRTMERLKAETERGCWFWLDWEMAMMYRDWPTQKAAPIAEGGREIVEQAEEEMFFAWGL
jgi:hypothetical protein